MHRCMSTISKKESNTEIFNNGSYLTELSCAVNSILFLSFRVCVNELLEYLCE